MPATWQERYHRQKKIIHLEPDSEKLQ